jgi:hypothetical protein
VVSDLQPEPRVGDGARAGGKADTTSHSWGERSCAWQLTWPSSARQMTGTGTRAGMELDCSETICNERCYILDFEYVLDCGLENQNAATSNKA